ncbi:hypothetical protein CCAX7_26060 [Capsulimonas corticalis]|uniref:Uncharacterized protein n=1 Tax=Capsulimonas corticalis TaxID=2219043 RepID=A0A402CVW6_9BACT|nr:toxin-antitoxin system HicB family antitoxin [Capsulimonas corticalis]BDI30555.1 hypothetical protein CCAX7_26060 [Capsulimonas corticalis]
MAANGYVHWAVVHNIVIQANHPVNGVMQTVELFVTNVPQDLEYQIVKDTIEQAGYFFGDSGVRWGNYQIVPDKDWITGWEHEFTYPNKTKISYDELLEQSKIEKRITLRLPPIIHNYLAYSASLTNSSLNQLITEILGDWQQDKMRAQVNRFEISVRHEIQSYMNYLEAISLGGPRDDLRAHRDAIMNAYDAYKDACRGANIQPDPDVLVYIPTSMRSE